jgi:CheY-like chemotaxis protein
MESQVKRSAVVVDDDIVYLQTVGLMLKKIGFSVDVKMFSNALDALRLCLKSEKTDLIVSDWDMPMMTGCEFLRRSTSQPKNQFNSPSSSIQAIILRHIRRQLPPASRLASASPSALLTSKIASLLRSI